jgi:hypothetical protein
VEHFHRMLKTDIMRHADQKWTEALPLILLGIPTALKEDLQASALELVHGKPLRVSIKLLAETANPGNPEHLIINLCNIYRQPQTSSGSMPQLPCYIRAQRPRETHACLPVGTQCARY